MNVLKPGVWGVLPTPFEEPALDVDTASLATVVRAYQKLGGRDVVPGVVALGVFGEAARLTADERERVLATVVAAAGDLEVVAGIPFAAADQARDEAARLAGSVRGIRALMVQVSSADTATLVRDLAGVHDASGLPVVVQDYPVSSGVSIAPAALAEAVAALPFVVAVKCESPPTSLAIARLAALLPGMPLFGGLGGAGLLDELCAGASGAMTGFSYPEALVSVVRAWRDGGFPAAREAISGWLPLINFEAQPGIGLGIRKEFIRRRGLIASAAVRPPGTPLPEELRSCLDGHLAALDSELGTAGTKGGQRP
ncbi:MAG TPA: dihydrodipicolinate synthase family protein [Trebonia sp.]|nr:dihydrodipicolinate synthase family protein [Trebonia sp.]